GDVANFTVSVRNKGKNTVIDDITLSIDGHSQSFTKIDPEEIDDLTYNQKKEFEVWLTVPNYTAYGNYTLKLSVNGDAHEVNTTSNITHMTAPTNLVLIVHSATEQETRNLFASAEKNVQEMIDSKLNTCYVSDLLEKARISLDGLDFDTTNVLSKEIIDIRNKAFEVFSLLERVKRDMDEASIHEIGHIETEKMYSLAALAFERGDYERAEERINNAILASSIEISGQLITAKFLQNYSGIILGIVVLAIATSFFGRRRIKWVVTRKRITFLGKEENVIRNLMKDLQMKHFEKREMGKGEYDQNIFDYESRLAGIEKERARLISNQIKTFRPGRYMKNMEREKKHITELMAENQRKYFELGKVNKTEYEERMNELRSELAEIEKNMEKRNPSKAYLLLLILLSGILIMPVVSAQTEEAALAAINQAELGIQEMQKLGFGTQRVNDTLNESKLLFSRGNYLGAESVAKYVNVIKQSALRVDSLIDDVEMQIYELDSKGIDVSEAHVIFNQGLESFDAGRYEEAEDLLNQAVNKLGEVNIRMSIGRSVESSRQSNLFTLIQQNWLYLLISVVAFVLVVMGVHKGVESSRRRNKIESLKREEKSIETVIKGVQKRYFEENKMPKNEYDLVLGKHQKRLGKIRKDIIVLSHRDKIKTKD
ncbi:MAG: hypothetical protein ABIH52_04730, partial [Candidatus Aenigmatarchaeota archaeon]